MMDAGGLGHLSRDRELGKVGSDIKSLGPASGMLRCSEFKSGVGWAETTAVTRNEILCSVNKSGDLILDLVVFLAANRHRVRNVRQPSRVKPAFDVPSINYSFAELLA